MVFVQEEPTQLKEPSSCGSGICLEICTSWTWTSDLPVHWPLLECHYLHFMVSYLSRSSGITWGVQICSQWVSLLNQPMSAQGTVLLALQLQPQHHCSRLSTDGGSNPYLYAPCVVPPKQRRLCWATGWVIVGSKLSVGLGTTVGYNRREEHTLERYDYRQLRT